MTFLAPWALAAGALGALGMVVLHLVAWQRPAAYVLPTTRFIPDQRTVVSRAATRPRDVLLLVLRVLTLLAAAAAFARPVMTPARGTVATIILADHSAAVADSTGVAARVRTLRDAGAGNVVIAFDSSLNGALVTARRKAAELADDVDSVRLVLVSPLTRSEVDAATPWLRAHWPGGVQLDRVASRSDSTTPLRVAAAMAADDPLAPSVREVAGSQAQSRLVRGDISAADSEFVREGGALIHWPQVRSEAVAAQGVVVGGEVVVAPLARLGVAPGTRVVAHWADGSAAATEVTVGKGCVREVGIGVPSAGDLPLHAPFQRMVRALLVPCGTRASAAPLDSSAATTLLGRSQAAAPASALRSTDAPPTPLVKWLLAAALLFAIGELVVRSRLATEGAT